jgi:glycosyltransferase involved in cell wall biosynthesis
VKIIKTAVFTIVSKNYLSFARTLLSSVKRHHPEWDPYVLLVDEVNNEFVPEEEPFEIRFMSDLNLPDFKKFIFRYNILELNTAVKPWMFSWLFNNEKNYDKVIYIDPDIYIYDRLTEVEEALNSGSLMVLTPHLSDFLNDDKKPSELNILQAGTYNLGFLAVARHADTKRFLEWWQTKLEYECTVDIPNGLFVDQKWMDMAPGFFKDVFILHHPGYNVAYWNLKHRNVTLRDGNYFVNKERLVFFHFSGVNPSNLSVLSKHQDRFTLQNIGDASLLVANYAKEVIEHGFESTKKWTYFYSEFQDGVKISDFLRIAYRKLPELQDAFGSDPYQTSNYILNTQCREQDRGSKLPLITHITNTVWQSRQDLQSVFPDIWSRDRISFCQWFIDSAEREYGLTSDYINPIKNSLEYSEQAASYEEREEIQKAKIKRSDWRRYCSRKLYNVSIRLKPIILKFIPSSRKERLKELKQRLLRAAYPPVDYGVKAENTDMSIAMQLQEKGINLIGYSRSETGVGESCRLAARAYDSVNIPFGIINYDVGNPARSTDKSWVMKEIENPLYNVNIFHVNADQIPVAFANLGAELFASRYNIGYWHWELPDFPDEWKSSFNYLNEIWVPTQFIADSISAKSPIPVVRIPHGIQLKYPEHIKRKDFELPENTFLFLTMYDTYSFQERKNPNAVIEAFKEAFNPLDNSVGLVIKVNHSKSNPEELALLKKRFEGYSNIHIIDETLSRDDVNALINCTDCFISLHRSEGFGLGLAEAMYLGKPAIGTNWSANVDFMNYKNSCVVDYKLVQIGKDLGPYKAYQYWADPDVSHAAFYMKKLVSDPDYYQQIAIEGQKTIHNEFSPEAVGEKVRNRLRNIGLL